MAVICLMSMTLKPKSSSLSEIISTDVVGGRWLITAFIGFRNLGRRQNSGDYFSPGRISCLCSPQFIFYDTGSIW
jgi:hypothetical protein